MFKNGEELLNICEEQKMRICEATMAYEYEVSGKTKEEIYEAMRNNLKVMREAVHKGLNKDRSLKGKIIGGEAMKLKERYERHKPVCGYTIAKAVSFALGVMEVNASMGRIVASPTAGSCGIIPATLLSLEQTHHVNEDQLINGLLTSSAIGIVIAKNATLSGAQGGCQAEVGSASAMAAAAVVEMMSGSPRQALHAGAIALKNLMGLICDPIAGLVEAPCSKRNAIGAVNALTSAEMALAGIESVIPFDEVVEAMYKVGRMMPCALRETALGGVAITKTGLEIKKKIFEE